MGGEGRAISVEELLSQSGWLRALAIRLAGDPDLADDAVQETWIAAMRNAPEKGETVRPWLAKVLRNTLRMRARADGRRSVREREAVPADDGGVPTPEALLARAEAQQQLAGLVVRLQEPYRTTVLLHFCEGLSLAEIARGQGIAASTARWRLKTALDQLREWLDAESGGNRRRALIPLMLVPKGLFVAQKSYKVVALVLFLLALLGGAGLYLTRSHGGHRDGDATAAAGHPRTPAGERSASPAGAQQPAPAWLAQPGVEPRRIAGRVTFGGAPVEGATVVLANLASESGYAAAPRRRTDAQGRFDFGPQPAMEWSVRASAPGKTGASLDIDLRNPVSTPPSDQLEIALGPCDAALFGTVSDASGGPVAGARLQRLPAFTNASIPGGVGTEADENGAYELCVERFWPGTVRVSVSADGYGAVAFFGMVLGRVKVNFSLVPEATIVGHVVRDDTGEPVPGAYVYVLPGMMRSESTAWRGTFTDAGGHFRIDQVAPGRHRIFARAEGMVASRVGTSVTVEAGQTTAEIEIRMEGGATLSGVALEGGKPAAGARVAAVSPDGTRSAGSAISQKDGSFVLTEVPHGQIQFNAWPYDVVSPKSFQVERNRYDDVVLEVEQLGSIVGQVVHGGQPVAGARIEPRGPNTPEVGNAFTDARGRFELRGLQPGPWVIFANDQANGRFGQAPATVQLERGKTEEVTIDLQYGASIAGKVVDQDGKPVPGVAVEFSHTARDDVGVAVTSVDGTFRAATMTGGGQYRTVVRRHQNSRETLPPASGTDFPLITLADGDAEVTGVVIAVRLDRLSIEGRVVNTSGSPMPDTRVTAAAADGSHPPRFFRFIQYATAVTDVDGHFAITDLSRGTYALQARAPSGAEVVATGIRAGRRDAVVTLPAPGTIEGTVTGFRQPPGVTAVRADQTVSVEPTSASVNGTSFSIHGLSPGTYIVAASGGGQAANAEVVVTAGATAKVGLQAGGLGSVAGTVVELRSGKPVEGMTCSVRARHGSRLADSPEGYGVRTDGAGAFTISPVPSGEVAVVCVGLWQLYTDGLRLIDVPPGKSATVEVPVVGFADGNVPKLADFGAHLDPTQLVPVLIDVQPEGPAASAGLAAGDLVIAVDGTSVTELSRQGVLALIADHPPGTHVKVSVRRGGKTITADLVLAEGGGPLP